MNAHLTPVIAGFIPLLDSSVLVVAAEKGFAAQEGIELKLIRETSWANIRDRIVVGHFDVAHMLAPMPIAATLNLTSLSTSMFAPMLLGLGGNAITVATALWREMTAFEPDRLGEPASTGRALAELIRARREEGKPLLRFGVVHPFSCHAYELRYWLAAAGIDPERDVDISVLAPQVMADALAAGQLDGYCVGEPWNTSAVLAGTGRIVTYKQAIWPNSPEKVLGVTEKWANTNPDTLAALLRALSNAADWCADPDNTEALATLLARPEYLNCELEVCLPALTGEMQLDQNLFVNVRDFVSFSGGLSAAPRSAHGKWLFGQMVRWGQAEKSDEASASVERVYSSQLYCDALELSELQDDDSIQLFDGSH
ncbi:MAG: ABC transporter substrate-binding protein [Roseibium sp.]|uniref:CmpA/NrtA family ABC transporter substrate-binding protein n=1 Tax=Roseibium sp. TaxID=1936156 RepID=UPI001B014A14|nr:CmpA/NrtA family ABC transporter substrate-binding protein [Roseibium sp.]MBO6893732.1 ABC transporter substrate-binding protein [Roseibium sp.]MBO6928553.1 ABC transporter substrate-binding protein [Roseibium sp.]